MSGARFGQVFRLDFLQTFRRPLFWVWIVILFLTAMGLASGDMQIASGDAMVGPPGRVTAGANFGCVPSRGEPGRSARSRT